MHILIVEDERKLAAAIAEGLSVESYHTLQAHTGEDALNLIRNHHFDLILLDIMLPQKDGLETLRSIRREGYKMPVLMLTSRDEIQDRVLGLDAGADDYMAKPFAFPELLARIRALLRRSTPEVVSQLQLGDLHLDLNGRVATRAGTRLDLTQREFDLLEYLLLHPGSVVSREMLARDIWQETLRYTSLDNVIDVQMVRLRRKLDDPFPVRLLHTVRGVGFVLREGSSA